MARTKGSTYKTTKSGAKVNQYGVRFTKNMQKELRSAVNYANRMRKELSAQLESDSRKYYKVFTKDTDFIYRKKSASLTQFKSVEEFQRYLKSVRKTSSKRYAKERASKYKSSYNKALFRNFGYDAMNIMKTIAQMDEDFFREITEEELVESISDVYYSPQQKRDKLDLIQRQFSKQNLMKLESTVSKLRK